MKIRESNGTFKVTITSLAGQELLVYREGLGSLTFELREVEEDVFENVVFERVPVAEEAEAVTAPEEAGPAEDTFVKEYARSNILFHKLSDLRRRLATEEKVAPYLIFHDKTLHEMVQKMPTDLSALGKVTGVGKSKLEKYGLMFLSVLQEGA